MKIKFPGFAGREPEKIRFTYLRLGAPVVVPGYRNKQTKKPLVLMPGTRLLVTSADRVKQKRLQTVVYTCLIGDEYPELTLSLSSKNKIEYAESAEPEIELVVA